MGAVWSANLGMNLSYSLGGLAYVNVFAARPS